MNLTKASSFNELVVNILIEELYRNKIDNFFISPGSRSTPLTSSVAYNNKLTKHIHFDERGAAFAALGYSRGTGKPGVLICTSGSAGANYFPAVCESSADSVPMIVITSDRPPELHNVLANQTCNQQEMFGEQVKDFYNIAPPDKNISLEDILFHVSKLVQSTTSYPSGVVHINCMFREPLVFKKTKKDYSKYASVVQDWIDSDKPFLKIKPKKNILSYSSTFDKNLPTILIAGALRTNKEAQAVVRFAEKNNLPIFPDIRSGLRLSNKSENLISYYDQILSTNMLQTNKQYQVIHVGGNIVSKRLLQFIEKSNIENYLVLHNSLHAYNPHHKMTESKVGSIEKLLQQLSEDIQPFKSQFLKYVTKCNEKVKCLISEYDYKFTEIAIARQLSQLVHKNSFIYSANSLSVRLLEMFADISDKNNRVIANRGLSGIDGTIASAVGFALGAKKRGTLLIGDLAFQHDINSLALLKKLKHPIILVLLNNNGGRIFSYLPIAKDKEIFTDYFDTPQNMIFESTAAQYDLPYYFISSTGQFKELFKKVQKLKQSSIIEIALQDSEIFEEQKNIERKIKKLV